MQGNKTELTDLDLSYMIKPSQDQTRLQGNDLEEHKKREKAMLPSQIYQSKAF